MLPREGSVPWRSRHRFKMAARDGVTEKRISEQRPQGRQQTRANRRTLQAGACQHRGPSLSEGFGGCSRKPTWQELREGLESRKKGRPYLSENELVSVHAQTRGEKKIQGELLLLLQAVFIQASCLKASELMWFLLLLNTVMIHILLFYLL